MLGHPDSFTSVHVLKCIRTQTAPLFNEPCRRRGNRGPVPLNVNWITDKYDNVCVNFSFWSSFHLYFWSLVVILQRLFYPPPFPCSLHVYCINDNHDFEMSSFFTMAAGRNLVLFEDYDICLYQLPFCLLHYS